MIIIRNIEPEDLAMALVDMAERYAAHRRRANRRRGEGQGHPPKQNHGYSNDHRQRLP